MSDCKFCTEKCCNRVKHRLTKVTQWSGDPVPCLIYNVAINIWRIKLWDTCDHLSLVLNHSACLAYNITAKVSLKHVISCSNQIFNLITRRILVRGWAHLWLRVMIQPQVLVMLRYMLHAVNWDGMNLWLGARPTPTVGVVGGRWA